MQIWAQQLRVNEQNLHQRKQFLHRAPRVNSSRDRVQSGALEESRNEANLSAQ